jgi:membrane-bound lytic murein transglycosylase B
MASLAIELPEEIVREFESLSEKEQFRLKLLLACAVGRAHAQSAPSAAASAQFTRLLDQMSAQAAARGLTPQVLQDILRSRVKIT